MIFSKGQSWILILLNNTDGVKVHMFFAALGTGTRVNSVVISKGPQGAGRAQLVKVLLIFGPTIIFSIDLTFHMGE